MTPGYGSGRVTRSLVAPDALYEGAAFSIPALGMAGWWHVADVVELADGERVRIILTEADHRGRPYRVVLLRADRVVWASTLAPATLAPPRLGHHVACPVCRESWGYLPTSVEPVPCFGCDMIGPTRI